jgi:hypothetical protein
VERTTAKTVGLNFHAFCSNRTVDKLGINQHVNPCTRNVITWGHLNEVCQEVASKTKFECDDEEVPEEREGKDKCC